MKRSIFIFFCIFLTIAGWAYNFAEYAKYDTLWADLFLEKNLPLQYKYLSLVLTDMNTTYCNDYAAGVWALSVPMAHHYGLRITADYDERYNVNLATNAAINYLKDLSSVYAGNVQKVCLVYAKMSKYGIMANIQQTNGFESQNITLQLSRLASIYKEQKNTLIHENVLNDWEEIQLDTTLFLTDFCELLQLEKGLLLENNPSLSLTATILRKDYRIFVPRQVAVLYNQNKSQLYAKAVVETPVVIQPTVAPPPPPPYVIYKVKSGDTLGHIALRYHVGVSQLKKWNTLRSDMLQIGQKIKIYK